MELYIEKEFLDDFFIAFEPDKASQSQKVVVSILTEYGEVDRFVDVEINAPQELEKLKIENPFFAGSNGKPPTPVRSIKEDFFEHANCRQTLIFMKNEQEWFPKAEQKGALCFTWGNYEERISKIIENTNFKIDLSEGFTGWDSFVSLQKVPFNYVLVNDNYLLTDKARQKMDKNIIPFLKIILKGKSEQEIKLDVYTKDFNPKQPRRDEQIKVAAKKRFGKLNRGLANFRKKSRLINNDLKPSSYDFHDRVVLSNFFSIDSGQGFNLIPHKKSNSQVIVETIFDKYTYKRIKNLMKMHNEYVEKLERLETVKFKMFP